MFKKLLLGLKILTTYRNGYLFFAEKLRLLKQSHVTYVTWRGMKYKCRVGTTDFAILNETTIFHEYDSTHEFYKLNDHSVVVDLGGQAGDFSIYTAFHKGASVFAFEPDEENFELLQENIRINNLQTKVFAYKVAVGRENGTQTFYLSPHGNKGVHSMYYKGPVPIEVPTIDLAAVAKLVGNEKINLLKIDIEGGEHEIIDPVFAGFYSKVEAIVMEYHCQEHVTNRQPVGQLVAKLEKLGFKVKRQGTDEIGIIYATKQA